MQRSIIDTTLYKEAEALYTQLRQPGTGQISNATEVNASPDGQRAVFAAAIMDRLEGIPPTRIAMTDLITGETRVLTFGPNDDRLPKFSPDGRCIAFLSDRHQAGDFQLYLLDSATGAVHPTPRVQGWVEYLHWSPDGRRILLGVAGHGADVAGGQGAIKSEQLAQATPSWLPKVETADEGYRWRRAWLYERDAHSVRQVSCDGTNVWEAVWCGSETLAAVVSPGPGEGLWYSAQLSIVSVSNGGIHEIYQPKDQLGWPSASPSGAHLAVVEAVCSDRWIVAGNLQLIETTSGKVRHVPARDVDVTCTEWRSEQHLLLAGHRGFETVVLLYDVVNDKISEIWSSRAITTGGFYVTVSGLPNAGDCVLVGGSFFRGPELGVIRGGRYEPIRSFDLGYAERAHAAIQSADEVCWKAPDGLEIQGWLLRPRGTAPFPLVMNVHGGPVWQWRSMWLGVPFLMLIERGYAIFMPNPRGSSGRGQSFIRHVVGDMGGADTRDYLSGLDHLVERGIADPERIGVTGGSYGGFMTSWLITQDSRFAAAVSVAPVTNQITQHLISNIPHFVAMFLADYYANPEGKYFQRSPVMHAHRARAPTLNICGALDRCTPPEEAVQFHNALLENGVESVLVTYPEEGHGVRKFPAMIDYTARLVGWFEENMGADQHLSLTPGCAVRRGAQDRAVLRPTLDLARSGSHVDQ